MTGTKPKKIYQSIRQLAEDQKTFSYYSLWELRRNCHENGFEKAFLKIGKKVLVDVNEFWDIIEKLKRG